MSPSQLADWIVTAAGVFAGYLIKQLIRKLKRRSRERTAPNRPGAVNLQN